MMPASLDLDTEPPKTPRKLIAAVAVTSRVTSSLSCSTRVENCSFTFVQFE